MILYQVTDELLMLIYTLPEWKDKIAECKNGNKDELIKYANWFSKFGDELSLKIFQMPKRELMETIRKKFEIDPDQCVFYLDYRPSENKERAIDIDEFMEDLLS